MNNINPFDIKEIKITLFLTMDIDTLIKIYPHNKELSERFNLQREGIQYKNSITTKVRLIESFYDLVFYVYLNDPTKKHQLHLSEINILKIVVQLYNYALFKESLQSISKGNIDFSSDFSLKVVCEAGKYNNTEIIKLILNNNTDEHDAYPDLGYVLLGLAELMMKI